MNIRQGFKDLARRGRVITGGDPRLRTPCEPVVVFDGQLARLEETIRREVRRINYKAKTRAEMAAGLAAPQLGKLVRLFVIDNDALEVTMVNPVIKSGTGYWRPAEHCLSLPGREFRVQRLKRIKVEAQDVRGNQVIKRFYGVEAQIVQHEIDHLNGVLLEDIAIVELLQPAEVPKG